MLSAMLSKVAETGKDWDRHLPFVLFAYRNSVQESTKESPSIYFTVETPHYHLSQFSLSNHLLTWWN